MKWNHHDLVTINTATSVELADCYCQIMEDGGTEDTIVVKLMDMAQEDSYAHPGLGLASLIENMKDYHASLEQDGLPHSDSADKLIDLLQKILDDYPKIEVIIE